MNRESAEVLNAVQQVLRGMTVSLAVSARVSMPELASLLQTFATSHALEPIAQRMLLDLAEGLDQLGGQTARQ